MDFISLAKNASGFTLGAGLGLGALGAYNEAAQQKAALKYSAAVNRNNAQIARWRASSILYKGARDEQTVRLETAQKIGAQRAQLAANGVDVNQGSALNLLKDSEYIGEMDALTTRDNAALDAWGANVEAVNYENEARANEAGASSISPGLSAATSLIGGAGQVASSWYNYRRATKGSGG